VHITVIIYHIIIIISINVSISHYKLVGEMSRRGIFRGIVWGMSGGENEQAELCKMYRGFFGELSRW